MTYEQQVLAFAAARFPEAVAAGLLLAVAARRWRDDRRAAGLLVAAGLCLVAHVAAEFPLFLNSWPGGTATEPLWRRFLPGFVAGNFASGWSPYWAVALLPAAAAACGLAAVFARPADPPPPPPDAASGD